MMPTKTQNGFWQGFFFIFGFGDTPASNETIEILNTQSGDRIRQDLQKIKDNYQSSFEKISSELVIK